MLLRGLRLAHWHAWYTAPHHDSPRRVARKTRQTADGAVSEQDLVATWRQPRQQEPAVGSAESPEPRWSAVAHALRVAKPAVSEQGRPDAWQRARHAGWSGSAQLDGVYRRLRERQRVPWREI